MPGTYRGQPRVAQQSPRDRCRNRIVFVLALAAVAAMVLPASAGAIADAQVTGKVTAQSGGAAIEGIEVCVYATSGATEECGSTEAKGEYKIEVPAGSYHVGFYSEDCLTGECRYLDYLTQYYNGKPREEEAETLVLKGSETRSAINAAMATGGTIEGQVTAAVGGTELAEVEVCVFSEEAEFIYRCSDTEEEGFYSIAGLPTAKYLVSFYDEDHRNLVSQYYDGKSNYEEATLVEAIAGTEKSGIGAKLHEGAKIEGVVTAAAGGAPVSDTEVCPVELTGAAEADCTSTNSEGRYTLEGLEGEYSVRFYGNGSTLGPELYENATKSSTEKVIKAVPPAVTKGVNGRLPAAGEITGVVTAAPSGSAVDGVEVCARSEAGFSECTKTGASGEYTIKGLAGVYSVEFYGDRSCTPGCSDLPYKNQYYNGAYSSENAEEVTVAPGATVTGINARLAESVKQGEEETQARKVAEAIAKIRAEELKQQEATHQHEQEVKAAEEAAAKAAQAAHAAAEEAAKRLAAEQKQRAEKAAIASVKIVHIRSTATTLLITVKVSGTDIFTVSGSAVKRTVIHIPAGTHAIKVRLTASGRSARAHRHTIKLTISAKVGMFVVALNRKLKL
jgi:hypothetical protein